METIPEEDYLQISGLQHYRFCPRQWALIHLEQQWAENLRTTEGVLLHERAHQEGLRESRGDLLTVRGLRVFSPTLGLSGACDVVEFRRGSGVPLAGREGLWQAYPVEYKRGSPKADSCDALQLCAQAMCLEEMLCCDIPEGALFYGEPRRREPVVFTEELRQEVRQCAAEMRDLYRRGRKKFLQNWQERKRDTITHPYLGEKLPWGLVPYVQALLLARYLRGDLDGYPPFLWK